MHKTSIVFIVNKYPWTRKYMHLIDSTRTRVDQHKCLPTSLALTQPCYSLNIFCFWPIIRERIRNLKKKNFHWFVELVKTNPLMYNTWHFDQYSRVAICLNIFWFSANNSKPNLKFEKKLSICL